MDTGDITPMISTPIVSRMLPESMVEGGGWWGGGCRGEMERWEW